MQGKKVVILLLIVLFDFNWIIKQNNAKRLMGANLNAIAMCSQLPSFLRKNTVLRGCSGDKTLMSILYNGSQTATKECQNQFKFRLWNCSSIPESLSKIVHHAFPETAYLFGIHSAGLAFSMAYACSRGLVKDCTCPKGTEEKVDKKTHTIVEDRVCSTKSIEYGIKRSRYLLKNIKERDARWLVDEHNKEAGRLALVSHTLKRKNKVCRCHGVSGACTITKCEERLPNFRQVSDFLVKKYNAAIKVGTDNYGKKLIPSEATVVKPTKQDLVYTEKSPNFCDKDLQYGSLGTKGRVCEKNKDGVNSCDVLCCNRGSRKITKIVEEPCKCIFKYCCTVSCKTCRRKTTIHVCK